VSTKRLNSGFTLVEILIATGILGFALCAILATYISCFSLISTTKNVNIGINAEMGLMEQIRSTPFAQLSDDPPSFTINGAAFTLKSTDLYECHFPLSVLPSGMAVVYINQTNSELLNVTISACWRQGLRIIGEDTNLNGVLNSGEDTNSNGMIDSPAQLVTRIANR